jgi:hypothetical protein
MAHMIEDGTGKGYLVQVNDDNQLHVKPFPNDLHQRSQETGRAYSIYLKRDISVANAEEALGILTYNGAGRLVISEMTLSLSITSTDYQYARVEVHVDPTGISGGTARTPVSLNRGSNVPSDTNVIAGDTAITFGGISVDTEIFHTQLSSNGTCTHAWLPQDALLLEKGDSIVVTAKGNSAGTLPGVRCTIRCYEEDLETV